MTDSTKGKQMIEVILQLCEDESCWIQHEKHMSEKFFRCKRLDE